MYFKKKNESNSLLERLHISFIVENSSLIGLRKCNSLERNYDLSLTFMFI